MYDKQTKQDTRELTVVLYLHEHGIIQIMRRLIPRFRVVYW